MNYHTLREGLVHRTFNSEDKFASMMSELTQIPYVTPSNWRNDLGVYQVNKDAEIELNQGGLVVYTFNHGDYSYVIHHYLTFGDGTYGDLFDVFQEYNPR